MAKARQQELQQKFTKQTGDYTRFKKSNEERMVERERELMEPVIVKINTFLKEWGDKNGYDMIFGTTSTGSLVHAKKTLDITDRVVKALNEKYKD